MKGKIFNPITIIVILVIFSMSFFLLRNQINQQLKRSLSEIINNDSTSLYLYEISAFEINILRGNVTLKNLKITPKPEVLIRLKEDTSDINLLFSLRVEKFRLRGFQIIKFLRTSKINIKSIELKQPAIKYYYTPQVKQVNKISITRIFNESFSSAEIEKIVFTSADVLVTSQRSLSKDISIENFDLRMQNAVMDSLTLKNYFPLSYSNIQIATSKIHYNLSDEFSMISDSLLIDVKDKVVAFKHFQILPNYSKQTFSNRHKYRRQWLKLSTVLLKFEKLQFDRLIKSGRIEIDRIFVDSPKLLLFSDHSKPKLIQNIKVPLPASMLKSLSNQLSINKVDLINGEIELTQKQDGNDQEMGLKFSDINISTTGISNEIKKQDLPPLDVTITATLMNEVDFSVNLSFDLNSNQDKFKVTGNCYEFNPEVFNNVLESTSGIRIKEGKIKNVHFDFDASDIESQGYIDLVYDNIKIDVLNQDSLKVKKRRLLSLATNTIMNSSNLKEDKKYVRGEIHVTRDQKSSIFPFIWNSLQSGIVATLSNEKR